LTYLHLLIVSTTVSTIVLDDESLLLDEDWTTGGLADSLATGTGAGSGAGAGTGGRGTGAGALSSTGASSPLPRQRLPNSSPWQRRLKIGSPTLSLFQSDLSRLLYLSPSGKPTLRPRTAEN
jgi:hypothetical protein